MLEPHNPVPLACMSTHSSTSAPQTLRGPGLPRLLCGLQEERAPLPTLLPEKRSPRPLTRTRPGLATAPDPSSPFPPPFPALWSSQCCLPEVEELRRTALEWMDRGVEGGRSQAGRHKTGSSPASPTHALGNFGKALRPFLSHEGVGASLKSFQTQKILVQERDLAASRPPWLAHPSKHTGASCVESTSGVCVVSFLTTFF